MRRLLFLRSDRSHRARLISGAGAAAVGALVLVVVVGCTSASESTAASSLSSPAMSGAGPLSAAGSSAASAAAAAPAGSAAGASSGGNASGGKVAINVAAGVQAADRDVIRTATVTLEIPVKSTGNTAAAKAADAVTEQKAVNDASVQVRALVANGPGFVGSSDGGGTTVSITLRVPVNGYNSAMDSLDRIGTITDRKEDTQDVTGQMLDIGSRMKTMAQSIDQVRLLLSKATKISDIIAIESQLSDREADLESLKSQQAGLSDQTSLSTITVVLRGAIVGLKPVVAPVAPAPPAARSGFVGGLANGWDAVRHIGHLVLTVLGTLIPFLPLVFVIALLVLIWRRRIRRPIPPVLATSVGDPHPVD
jgi:hypothetical protein